MSPCPFHRRRHIDRCPLRPITANPVSDAAASWWRNAAWTSGKVSEATGSWRCVACSAATSSMKSFCAIATRKSPRLKKSYAPPETSHRRVRERRRYATVYGASPEVGSHVVLRAVWCNKTARKILVRGLALDTGRTPRKVGLASLSGRCDQAGNATVLNRAFSACRESRRVCCTTMGTVDSTTLA